MDYHVELYYSDSGSGKFQVAGTNITTIDGGGITTGMIRDNDAFVANEDGEDFTAAGMVIDLDSGNIATEQFKIVDGNAAFKGTITGATGIFSSELASTSGTIGGWRLHDGYISSTSTAYEGSTYSSAGITLNASGSIHAPNFYMDVDGKLTAKNATFTGYDNSIVASSIKLIGDDTVNIGNGVEISVGGTDYNVVGAFIDGGPGDTAGVVGICSQVGVAGRGAEGGVYGETGSSHWGWLGHTQGGLYGSSCTIGDADGTTYWKLPTARGTDGQFLKQNDNETTEWATVSGTGTVTSITFSGGLSSTQAPLTTTGTVSIAPLGVTLAKMATNSVDSDQYVDGSIDAEHLADDSIDEASLKVDNSPTDDYVLTAKSSASGGLTWAEGGSGSGDISRVNIIAGTGLTGGGTSGTVTLNIDTTGVSATSYTNTDLTVNAQGQITTASSGTAGITAGFSIAMAIAL